MNKKTLITIILLTFFLSINNINASDYNNYIIEDLTTFSPDKNFNIIKDNIIKEEDLNIEKIKYLPNNFKYNLKKANSKIDEILSITKTNKAKLQIKEALTNTKELELCYKKNDTTCIRNSVENYSKSKKYLYHTLEAIKPSTNIIIDLFTSEINENTILKNVLKTYKNTTAINSLIEQDNQLVSNFIDKLDIGLLDLKESIKKATETQNKNKSLLNILVINKYLEGLQIPDKKIKTIFNQIIEENYKSFIENINNLNIEKDNIDVEKNLRYYLYYKYNNNIVEEINLINKLYNIQKTVNNSKINSIIKSAILNSKKSPIAILSSSLEQDVTNINNNFEKYVIGSDIEKINIILLLEKQNVSSEDSFTDGLKILEEKYTEKIYSNLININNVEKEKQINEYIEKLSNENISFIKILLDKLQNSTNKSNVLEINILINKFKNTLKDPEENIYDYCPKDYKPVCGINKKTYTNSCFIEMVSIKIDYKGECAIEENTKLQNITEIELTNGWYYGTDRTKKPGTPTNWILINKDSPDSKWIDSKKILNIK